MVEYSLPPDAINVQLRAVGNTGRVKVTFEAGADIVANFVGNWVREHGTPKINTKRKPADVEGISEITGEINLEALPKLTDTTYTVSQVAKKLKMNRKTVLKLIHIKEMAAIKTPGGFRIHRAALMNYVNNHMTGSDISFV